ncbi:MAG TPA: GPR1/FUN34/YaaH family transporter [Tepidisphaeraceae bacterium]|nr:GPR1/FUN34/YaaH family transporter [Tepidisphaeraceae bacterium]
MWSYKARDGIGTAMHGMWGSFWMAYGIFQFLVAAKIIQPPQSLQSPEFGFWFLVLAGITWSGAFASVTQNLALASVLFSLAFACTIECVARFDGSISWQMIAGYIFVISAFLAWYTGTALMVEGAAGKAVLPVFKLRQKKLADAGVGEPGVQRGQ